MNDYNKDIDLKILDLILEVNRKSITVEEFHTKVKDLEATRTHADKLNKEYEKMRGKMTNEFI